MELNELYELHDRLEAAAAAGVNLAGEDFRLRRAIEGIAPLAEASPVIKKLYRMAMDTAAPDCRDRAGSLLDTLALSQALLCTQAGFGVPAGMTAGTSAGPSAGTPAGPSVGMSAEPPAGMSAEPPAGPPPAPVLDLQLAPRPHCPCRPYSVVQPLEEALTHSGGGRYARIAETVRDNSQDLEDYRLQAAMVTALSDRFADIAAAAEQYLSSRGADILPLVKKNFSRESDGGKLRRLRVVESAAGGAENDFYVSLLEHSTKELREEVIYALRFEKGNAGLLLDLSNTEKGSCLEMVRQSLAYMESEEVERYLEELFARNPLETAGYLRMSRSDALSDCLAAQISLFLDQYDESGSGLSGDWCGQFELLFQSMPGKASEAMQQIYRRAARSASMTQFLYLRFPDMLTASILWGGDPRLVDLARDLAASAGKWWIAPAFAADLLTVPAGDVYSEYKGRIPKNGFLGREEKKEIRKAMMTVLGRINYNRKTDRHEMAVRMEKYGSRGKTCRSRRPLMEPLDPRWYELLMDSRFPVDEKAGAVDGEGKCADMTYDQILFKLLPAERRKEAGAYFYNRALEMEDNRVLYQPLIQCGWENLTGLVPLYVKNHLAAGYSIWDVKRFLSELPLTDEQQQMEIREIDRMICACPKNSEARKNWDAYAGQRKAIDEAAGLPGGK